MQLKPSIAIAALLAVRAATIDIPRPSVPQLAWQKNEIMALVHFNMATFFHDGDPGCTALNWPESQKPASFAPSKLNVTQWIESMKALGIKEAVLTAKHGCGFLLWPTASRLPNGQNYTYHVSPELNVLRQFREAAEKAGIGHGFYYSLTNNFYLNVRGHYVQKGPLLPGQQNVTQAEFEAVALAQLTELWTEFGQLNEIWFDGGYTTDMQAQLTTLLAKQQPAAVGYNGGGISRNPARWSATEGDVPPGDPEIWSTACGDVDWGAGHTPEDCLASNKTALFYPSGTDFTLQSGDVWFWEPPPTQKLRTLDELVFAYHETVGHNTVLELDFAIDREGLVDASHAALYKRFGDWISRCYGSPIATATAAGAPAVARLPPDVGAAAVFDRVVLAEDQRQGQRVRAWTVEWSADGGATWALFGNGSSIGNKRIVLAPGAASHTATDVRLNITRLVDAGGEGATSVTLQVFAPCSMGSPAFIHKLGTEDIGMTETTPFAFKGELYRFESVRSGYYGNTLNCTNTSPGEGRSCTQYLRVRELGEASQGWRTGAIATAPFGLETKFGCAFVEDATVYTYSTTADGSEIVVHSAKSISMDTDWTAATALPPQPTYTLFNTAVAKGELAGKPMYAMAIEVRQPQLGGGFQLVFATSPSALGPWSLQQSLPKSKGLMFGAGSCPALRFDASTGFWHMLYTPNPTVPSGGYRTWQVYAVRSKTLEFGSWEPSPLNPMFVADALDRFIHNPAIPASEQGWARNTTNLNDSDADLVEFEGKVLFVGNWGDQKTTPTNNLYTAWFDGSMEELWQAMYPAA